MLHLDSRGAVDGEWISEPPAAARKYKLEQCEKRLHVDARTRILPAGACGGERLRSILTFVSAHLGLTLQQSSLSLCHAV